jgi:hypothetical protein
MKRAGGVLFLLLLSTLAVIAGRLFIPGHDLSLAGSYEAAAHIWCGWIVTVAYYRRGTPTGRIALVFFISATVLETAMFLNRE